MMTIARLFDHFIPAASRAFAPDPIDHPDLGAMSLRELADLPFPRPAPREEDHDAIGARLMQPPEPHEIRPAA